MKDSKIVELKHTSIEVAKPEAKKVLDKPLEVPRLSVDIIERRWRAVSKHGTLLSISPDIEEIIKAALQAIIDTNIVVDQRDIYYSLRMGHPDWTLAGHPLKTEQAYNNFVGQVMEKLQLATGFTMQSLGVRAGPRGYITGDEGSYFILDDGRKIPVSASPVIQFNLVDEGVKFETQTRKLIHYEKAAGMNSLIISDMPTMIEALFMTSQGYNVEAATKMHSDMEKRGLRLFVLGDADPHGMAIQLMYGRASKSNAYMPDSFYPKTATLLGLFPRIANELDLPPEHVTDVHLRVIPNLKKIMRETHPELLPDAEVMEKERKQWEWQSLNGLGPEAPAIYLVESLYAKGDEIKYVPKADEVKKITSDTIREMVNDFVEDKIDRYAKYWLIDNLLDNLKSQIKEHIAEDVVAMEQLAEEELRKLEAMSPEDLREAVKLKLVKNPKQYWTDALRKLVNDILSQKFNIDSQAEISGNVDVSQMSPTEYSLIISNPEVPEEPLKKIDIVESIEKRVTRKQQLINRLRTAIQAVFGTPSEEW